MKMKVVVDSPEDYAKWLSSQPNLASTSTPAGPEGPQASKSDKVAKTLASK
jgi:heme/copper-type cytochrome/quinol oxidase subunit 2